MTINATRGTTHLCDLGIILVIYFLNLLLMCECKNELTLFAHIFKMTFWLFPLMCHAADLGIFKSMN